MRSSDSARDGSARFDGVRLIRTSGTELDEFQQSPFNLTLTRQLGQYHWRLKGWNLGKWIALPELSGRAVSLFAKRVAGGVPDTRPAKSYYMCREWECTQSVNVGRRGHISVGHRHYKPGFQLVLMQKDGTTVLPDVFSDISLISAIARLEGVDVVPPEVSVRKLSGALPCRAYDRAEVMKDILKDVGMFFLAVLLLPFWIKDFKGFKRNKR